VFPLSYTNKETDEISKGYKEEGYFADSFINMLAFLGWNPGTEQEIFSLDELVKSFDLKRVSKSGAKFNPDKTKWFNQQYMQQKNDAELTDLYLPILSEKGFFIESETKKSVSNDKITSLKTARYDELYVQKVVASIKERAIFVADFWELSSFFFEAPTTFDEKASKKNWKENTSEIMHQLIAVISTIEDFSSANTEKEIKEWITTKEIGFGQVMQPLRLSLVGALKGPHLFDIIEMIGKEESIKRIENAIKNM
jgi:glutamyl-tRNA synthetase